MWSAARASAHSHCTVGKWTRHRFRTLTLVLRANLQGTPWTDEAEGVAAWDCRWNMVKASFEDPELTTKQGGSFGMVTSAPSCLCARALNSVWLHSVVSPRGHDWTPARHVACADRLGVSGAPAAAAKWLPGRESEVTSSLLCSNSAGLFGAPPTSVCYGRVCLASTLRRSPCLAIPKGAAPGTGSPWGRWTAD